MHFFSVKPYFSLTEMLFVLMNIIRMDLTALNSFIKQLIINRILVNKKGRPNQTAFACIQYFLTLFFPVSGLFYR